MHKVVISGYYGFDNLGDEAVLAGCVKGLRKIKPDLDITVLSHTPVLTADRYNVKSVARNNIKMVVEVLKNSDLLISGGGSLLQDVTGWKSIPYYLGQVIVADLLDSRVVLYAQGIGPVKNTVYKKLIKWVGNRCNLVTLRDQHSRELLLDFGVRNKLIKVYTDPAFLLQTGTGSNFFSTEKRLIGVAVRSWENNKFLNSLAKGIEYLADMLSAEIIIIPFHYYEDREISENLKDQLACNSKVLEEKYRPEEMLDVFSGLDFCIGVRLHSLIFATISRIPFVGISYDPKVTAFLEGLGLNCDLNIEELSTELLIKEIERVWRGREEFVHRNTAITENYREIALKNICDILELI